LRNGDVEQAITAYAGRERPRQSAYAEHGRIHTSPDTTTSKQQLVEPAPEPCAVQWPDSFRLACDVANAAAGADEAAEFAGVVVVAGGVCGFSPYPVSDLERRHE